MKRVFRALRTWFRGDRPRPSQSIRLTVETLEDRLALASDFRSIIGADAVLASFPYRGAGYTVAVLDTGIDYNHADLGAGFGAGKRVVAGYDFINNDADPMDDNGHGTHLAGTIGGGNADAPGIAPDVRFAALKVLDANMNGNWTAVEKALQWVITNQSKYNIVSVNLSLGSGNYTSNPYSLLEDEFSTLKTLGVFTAVAAGNRYYTFNSQPGLGYPSVSPNVVSVGATWAADYTSGARFSSGATESAPTADHLVSLSQRSSALSILAPGAWINSTGLDNSYQTMGGTSMATAVVSGAAALLHQAYDQTGRGTQATQDNLLRLMQATGTTIVDLNYGTDNVGHTNLSFKRLNLKRAIDTIGQPVAPPTLAPIANQTLAVGSTIVVPLSVTAPSGAPITLGYTQSYLPAAAYQIDQRYGLNYLGSYYTNKSGVSEKWVLGTGSIWYAILPTGEVRRWTGSVASLKEPANLVTALDGSYWTDPSKLWNAPYAGMPPAVFAFAGTSLSIRAPSYWLGTYQVTVRASDGRYTVAQTFNVTEVPANSAPVLAGIANQTIRHSPRSLALDLSATDADRDAVAFSAQVLPIHGVTPQVSVSVQGNRLSLAPALSFVGTFRVQVGASDGKASVATAFDVAVTNASPTFDTVAAQTMAADQLSKTITLPIGDADGDALTLQAVALTPDAALHALQQQYGFAPASGSYYFNLTGNSEKWLMDRSRAWYALLPTGKLYRWNQTMAQTMTAANLVAPLSTAVHAEPRLLWNAHPATTPALSFSYQGNQWTIQRPANLTGVLFVDITVSDGAASVKRTIQLTLN